MLPRKSMSLAQVALPQTFLVNKQKCLSKLLNKIISITI